MPGAGIITLIFAPLQVIVNKLDVPLPQNHSADLPRRDAGEYGLRGEGLGDDAAGPDQAAIAQCDTFCDDASHTNKTAVANLCRGIFVLQLPFGQCPADGIVRQEMACGRNGAVGANLQPDSAAVQAAKRTDPRMIPDCHVAAHCSRVVYGDAVLPLRMKAPAHLPREKIFAEASKRLVELYRV